MNTSHLTLLCIMLAVTSPALADPSREAALFGGPATETESESAGKAESEPVRPIREAVDNAKRFDTPDPLQIGGKLYLRTQSMITDGLSLDEVPLDSSGLLYLYGDARPTPRIRAFAKARIDHRFTESRTLFSTAIADAPADTRAQLDQLWLKFDIGRVVFLTVGQQPVRWGTTRIWNPVDFVNAQRKDPLAIFDARPGIPLVKLHVPIESLGDGANVYAIAQLDGAGTLAEVGGLLRAEVSAGPTETGINVAVREDQPLRLGADFSGGIGPLELRFEGRSIPRRRANTWEGPLVLDPNAPEFPVRKDRSNDWIPQASAGLEWGIPYGDDDTAYLTLEYFFNDAGYDDETIYPWLIFQGDFSPLYLGRHYVGLGLALPRPGGWNDTTLLATAISNLSDGSHIARLDYQVQVLTRLRVFCFVGAHFGNQGEFRFELDVPAVPGIPELENGLRIEPMRFNTGLWLSVDL